MGTSKTSICQIFSELLKNWNCNPGLYSINSIFYLFHELGKLRMFKIRRIDTSIFHCIICSQLLLFCFPEIVSMNAFLNDQINIFCCKHLICFFFFCIHRFYFLCVSITRDEQTFISLIHFKGCYPNFLPFPLQYASNPDV